MKIPDSCPSIDKVLNAVDDMERNSLSDIKDWMEEIRRINADLREALRETQADLARLEDDLYEARTETRKLENSLAEAEDAAADAVRALREISAQC
jgi:predicted nuclease with TOPRIM domain